MRPLCSAFQSLTGGLSMLLSHWPSLTTWSQSGLPCSTIRLALRVFTWNNSTAAVGKEQGPGKRRRDGEPKMDMANLFKHFFREFSTFLIFCSSFFELCCLVCITSGVESFCLKFERFFILSLTVQKWLSGCFFFHSSFSDFSLWFASWFQLRQINVS